MTTPATKPRNGRRQHLPDSTSSAGTNTEQQPPENTAPQSRTSPDELEAPAEASTGELETIDRELQRRNTVLDSIVTAQSHAAYLVPRNKRDQQRDERAARSVRDDERRDWLRRQRSQLRARRQERWRVFWDGRAERLRQRILDPARHIGAVQRTWTACATVMILILGGALLYLTDTVKHGVVGENGGIVGYFIEPTASAMLVVSLAVQLLGQRSGRSDLSTERFFFLDVTLCAASMFFTTVPWGLRYGWHAGETLTHLIVPALVALGVVCWHLCASTVTELLRRSHTDPVLEQRLGILRAGIASGALDPNPSKRSCENHLRHVLGGLNREEAHRTIRHFLGT